MYRLLWLTFFLIRSSYSVYDLPSSQPPFSDSKVQTHTFNPRLRPITGRIRHFEVLTPSVVSCTEAAVRRYNLMVSPIRSGSRRGALFISEEPHLPIFVALVQIQVVGRHLALVEKSAAGKEELLANDIGKRAFAAHARAGTMVV